MCKAMCMTLINEKMALRYPTEPSAPYTLLLLFQIHRFNHRQPKPPPPPSRDDNVHTNK